MNRNTAVKTIKEIFEADSLGIAGTMSDEQAEAVKMALNALENPDCMACGYCQKFVDEDTEGEGWCEHHDRSANCNDQPCGYYE